MKEEQLKSISKFLSLILRHNPDKIGLKLNQEGWADVEELLAKATTQHNSLNRDVLEKVVSQNDKQRFAFNEDRSMIRASQGHSIEVTLDLKASVPPEYLYHGTVSKYIESIKADGLKKMSRHHVHLSKDRETAAIVGGRRGVPVILTMRSGQMYKDGKVFYLSDNQVWLTDEVPSKYIQF